MFMVTLNPKRMWGRYLYVKERVEILLDLYAVTVKEERMALADCWRLNYKLNQSNQIEGKAIVAGVHKHQQLYFPQLNVGFEADSNALIGYSFVTYFNFCFVVSSNEFPLEGFPYHLKNLNNIMPHVA